MEAAMFRSIGQALHFAYLMETLPVSRPSMMGVALERLMKENGVWRHPVSTLNFAGMNPMEVRGQCAMIRAVVDDHLAELERACIKARYVVRNPDRAPSIEVLVRDAAPQVHFESLTALRALVWGCYLGVEQREGFSYRKIQADTGVSISMLSRSAKQLRHGWRAVEEAACEELVQLFSKDQLIAAA